MDKSLAHLKTHHKKLLNRQEQLNYRHYELVNNLLAASFVFSIPYTMITSNFIPQNFSKFYPRTIKAFITVAVSANAMLFNSTLQKEFRDDLARKYFSHMTDWQLENFDDVIASD